MSADLNIIAHRLRQNGYGVGPSGESARRADLEQLSHALGLAEATIDHLVSALGSEVNGPTSLGEPSLPHPDDAAVDRFACAMKLKLAAARDNGRAGWNNDEPGMQQRLSDMLRAHVEKGDPRDVANFCMFLHQRGEGISPSTAPASSSASIARPSMQFTLRQVETLLAFFGGANADMTVEYFPANHWPDNPTAPAGLYVYCTEYPDEGALWLGEENNDEAIEPTWQHIPPETAASATPDVVGHKTFHTPERGFWHEPLYADEAQALWDSIEANDAQRAKVMPSEESAIRLMFEAGRRLKDFGWNDAIYCPKDRSTFQVLEFGSTGKHPCIYEGEWPSGSWWIVAQGDMSPSRPVLWKPLDAAQPEAKS